MGDVSPREARRKCRAAAGCIVEKLVECFDKLSAFVFVSQAGWMTFITSDMIKVCTELGIRDKDIKFSTVIKR